MIEVSLCKRDNNGNKILGERVSFSGTAEWVAKRCEQTVNRSVKTKRKRKAAKKAFFGG